MPPKSRKTTALPCPPEDDEQIALFEWINLQLGRWPELVYAYHVPNGGHRNKLTAMVLKGMGVKRGVPDVHIPVPKGPYHGLWIELKKQRGGRLEQEQRIWLSAMKRLGHYCVCCEGWEEAARYIEAYMQNRL